MRHARLITLFALLWAPGCFHAVDDLVPTEPPRAPGAGRCPEDLRPLLPSSLADGSPALFEAWPPFVPAGGFLWVRAAGLAPSDVLSLRNEDRVQALERVSEVPGEVALQVPESLAPGAYEVELWRDGVAQGCTVPATVFAGRVFFVAPDGDDGAAGTRAAPWRTPRAALSRLQAGDFAYLRAGTWGENLELATSGEPGRPLGLSGYPGETARIELTSSPPVCFEPVVKITGSDVLVDRLSVSSVNRACQTGISVYGDTFFDNLPTRAVTVSNCEVSELGSGGLFLGAPASRGHRNHVHHIGVERGFSAVGISVVGRGSRVSSNLVHDVRDFGLIVGSDVNWPSLEPTFIEDNVVWNAGVGDRTYHDSPAGYGIGVLMPPAPVVVRGNVSCGNAATGYQLHMAQNVLFDGNVSCFNPRALTVEASEGPAWLLNHVSFEDGLAREVLAEVVGNGNAWFRRDRAVKFSLDGSEVGLETVRASTGQESDSSLEDPELSGVPPKDDPLSLARFDFCSPRTPLLCGRR